MPGFREAYKAAAPSIATHLRAAGYRTAYFGKWHLGDEVFAQHGFEEWLSCEDNYREYFTDPSKITTDSDYHQYLVSIGFPPDKIDEDSFQPVFSRTMAAAMPAVPAEPRELPEPRDIPRPDSEKVVAAIKRLSQTYFMLDKSKMLGYTSDLMTQHIIHGRDGVEVIDELELVFLREYEKLKPE